MAGRESRGDASPRKIPLIFFRTSKGAEPVPEWLKGLPVAERQSIGQTF